MADQPASRSDGSGARRRRISLVSPGGHVELVPERGFGAGGVGVDRRPAVHHVVVDPVLGKGVAGVAPELVRVALVVAEQRLGIAVAAQRHRAELRLARHQRAIGQRDRRPLRLGVPRPAVAEPQVGQHVERRGVGAGVAHRDPHADVRRAGLGVVDRDVPVAVLVEQARVEQLVLALVPAAGAVDLEQLLVGELTLRVHVAPAHPRVRRGRVEVPPVLLGVLAVVALVPGQPEDALLQDRVAPVPEGERQTQQLLVVADAAQAVLAPAIGARPRLVVGEVRPRLAVGAVVLAHGAPGPLAQIRAPAPPLVAVVVTARDLLTCHVAALR